MKRFFSLYLLFVSLSLLLVGNLAVAEDDEYTVYVDEGEGADAYVKEGYPDNKYGDKNTLYVGWDDYGDGFLYRSWLKFDLTSLSLPEGTTVASAELHLRRYGNAGTISPESVYYSSDDTWSESSITWNNQPSFNSSATDTVTPDSDGWYTWDVTSSAKTAYEGDNKLTLVLGLEDESVDNPNDDHWTYFASKDNTDHPEWKPYLTATATPEPASIILFGSGLLSLGFYLKRRKKHRTDDLGLTIDD